MLEEEVQEHWNGVKPNQFSSFNKFTDQLSGLIFKYLPLTHLGEIQFKMSPRFHTSKIHHQNEKRLNFV